MSSRSSRRRRQRLLLIIGVVVLVLFLAGGTWLVRNWHGTAGSPAFQEQQAETLHSLHSDFPHQISAEIRADPNAMLRELLRRFSIAMAGREGFDRLQSLRVEGEVYLPDGVIYPYVLSKRAPNRIRLQMSQQGVRIIHGFDGVNAWRSLERMGELLEVKAIPLDEMEAFVRHSEITPELHNFAQKGWNLRYAGKVDWNDRTVYKIEGNKGDQHNSFYLDASSFLEIGRESWRKSNPDEREITHFRDYQRFDGFQFATEVEHFQNEKWVQRLKIDSIELNSGILNHLFSRPIGR